MTTDVSHEEICQYLDSRVGLYNLLSRMFYREPTMEFLDELAEVKLPVLHDGSLLDAGYERLRTFLRNRSVDALSAARAGFCRVLLGAGVTEIGDMASPYESVYRSDEKMLMQDARDEVVRLYSRAGVAVENASNEPEDHIAFELAFASSMFAQARNELACGNSQKAQESILILRELFENHLYAWVPLFCQDVARLSCSEYLRALASIAWGLVNDEPAYLAFCDHEFNRFAKNFTGAEFLPAEALDPYCLSDPQKELTDSQKRAKADDLLMKNAHLKRPLTEILEFCLEPQGTDAVEARTAKAMEYVSSACEPVQLRNLLVTAFCLEKIEVPIEDDCAEKAEATAEGDCAANVEASAEDVHAETIKAFAEGDRAAEDARFENIDAGRAGDAEPVSSYAKFDLVDNACEVCAEGEENGLANGGDEGKEIGFLSANDQGGPDYKVVWKTTQIGKEHIEKTDAKEMIKKLFEQDAAWLSGYEKTLEVIKNGTGTFQEVEAVIKPMELYQKENKHAAMFLKRLEESGALVWRDKWVVTPEGEQALQNLLSARSSTC